MTIFVRLNSMAGSDGNVVLGYGQAQPCGDSDVSIQDHHRSAASCPTLPNQNTEAKIGCNVLNRMTSLGMPISIRIK